MLAPAVDFLSSVRATMLWLGAGFSAEATSCNPTNMGLKVPYMPLKKKRVRGDLDCG